MCFSAASLGAKGFDYFEKERKNRDWSGIKATEQQKSGLSFRDTTYRINTGGKEICLKGNA